MTGFQLTPELAALVAREVYAPRAAQWDLHRTALPPEDVQRLADLGFLGSVFPEEYGVERLDRDSDGWAIAGGTPAIQRIRVASELLGRPFSQRPPEGVV